jgi:hypothetical protein
MTPIATLIDIPVEVALMYYIAHKIVDTLMKIFNNLI